jgi:hypothetical protein
MAMCCLKLYSAPVDRSLQLRGVLVTLLLPLAAGCGDRPELVPVSGTVLIDGQPLAAGNVKFVPDGARASWGVIGENGKFTLSCYERHDGAAPATHRVQISAVEILSGNKSKWLAPRKYADFRTSGLSFDITEPTEDLTINLTWDGGKPFVE